MWPSAKVYLESVTSTSRENKTNCCACEFFNRISSHALIEFVFDPISIESLLFRSFSFTAGTSPHGPGGSGGEHEQAE